jgi:uncharacterized RDD family membrane protein YckC
LGREQIALRQSAEKVEETSSWKQEVNRRIAEHNGRKNAVTNEPQANPDVQHPAGSLAAQAAARVAARYAKAPSYSELMAEEARAAVRAAEAASKAALEAQAAAESVLAGIEAASSAQQTTWDEQFFTAAEPKPSDEQVRSALAETARAAGPVPSASAGRQSFEIRWDEDLPVREAGPAGSRASHGNRIFESAAAGNAWQAGLDVHGPLETQGFEVVEPAQPIHANLIEFPRELVATRRVRPRRAEGPYAAAAEQMQLSIFEVEPLTISTEPAAGLVAGVESAAWTAPDWSGITLDEEPQVEMASYAASAPAIVDWAEPNAVAIQSAHINQRVMAALVDFSLIAATFLGAALTVLSRLSTLPAMRTMEAGSVAGMATLSVLYLVFFFTLGAATPGMMYANLELRTFRGGKPSLAQRMTRMGALIVSLLPLGLGVALALFDDQQLCWHDRLSGTYLRKG